MVTDNAVHFFRKNSLATVVGSVDIQRIDIGIAICHFDLAAKERNMSGHFERQAPNIVVPEDMTYVISWIKE